MHALRPCVREDLKDLLVKFSPDFTDMHVILVYNSYILKFLAHCGYEHPINAKSLMIPTTKEFLKVFSVSTYHFLLACISVGFLANQISPCLRHGLLNPRTSADCKQQQIELSAF
jgi:hypothetical protein